MDAVLSGVDVVATSGFGALEQFNVSGDIFLYCFREPALPYGVNGWE